jgi:hypothetical protein
VHRRFPARAVRLLVAGFTAMSAHAACSAPEARQFDFWLGDWVVVGVPGTPGAGRTLGHNRITKIAAGCGLSEHWRGASGLQGHSLNAWDAAGGVWRQFWVGGDGVVLQLSGGLVAGRMQLEGVLPGAGGGEQRQRIAWTPNPDGSVTQRWDTSDDAGASWQLAFLGLYRRSGDGVP